MARPLSIALALVSLAACTAGSGPGTSNPPVAREPTGGGQEPGSTGPEPATGVGDPGGPSTGDNGGGSGGSGSGSSSGATGNCPPCNAGFVCTGPATNGQERIDLVSVGASCNIAADQGAIVTLTCGGAVTATFDGGTVNVGTWSSDGNGGFAVVDASGNTTSCTPAAQPPAPSAN